MTVPTGAAGDVPFAADFNGDGALEIGVFRPSIGTWIYRDLDDAFWGEMVFGLIDDQLAPSDFDGDGRTDFAVFRATSNRWLARTSTGALLRQPIFGVAAEVSLEDW